MTEELYFSIGALIASVGISFILLIALSCLVTWAYSYVDDGYYTTPKLVKYIGTFPPFLDCYDASLMCVFIFIFSLLIIPFWPIAVIFLSGYSFLRIVRFTFRIKKSIVKLLTNKKCLKDYKDHDYPKMEF